MNPNSIDLKLYLAKWAEENHILIEILDLKLWLLESRFNWVWCCSFGAFSVIVPKIFKDLLSIILLLKKFVKSLIFHVLFWKC
jgi:hypothetical protein